tara:strand:- start:110 stop:661 length:552 start_codon:yes stop_codon:yes gene_type:complete
MLLKKLKTIKKRFLGQFVLEDYVKMGLIVGRNFKYALSTRLDYTHCWHIKIGDDVTFAPDVMVLAHDTSTKLHLNHTKIRNVIIGNRVFVGARVVILPGVNIGNDVIIGAGSLVSKDIPSGSVVTGNPAKIICSTTNYINNQKKKMLELNVFSSSYTVMGNITEDRKLDMISKTTEFGQSFVV